MAHSEAIAHKQEHRRLAEDLLSIQRDTDQSSLMVTLQSLKDWLVSHVIRGDRELADTLIACGAMEALGTRHEPVT